MLKRARNRQDRRGVPDRFAMQSCFGKAASQGVKEKCRAGRSAALARSAHAPAPAGHFRDEASGRVAPPGRRPAFPPHRLHRGPIDIQPDVPEGRGWSNSGRSSVPGSPERMNNLHWRAVRRPRTAGCRSGPGRIVQRTAAPILLRPPTATPPLPGRIDKACPTGSHRKAYPRSCGAAVSTGAAATSSSRRNGCSNSSDTPPRTGLSMP